MHQKIVVLGIVLTFKNYSMNIFRMDLFSWKYEGGKSHMMISEILLHWHWRKKDFFLFLIRLLLFPDVFSVVHLWLQIPNFRTFMIYLHDSIPTYKTNYDSTQHWHCIFHPFNNPQMRKVRIISPVSLMKKTEIKMELELEFYSRSSDSSLVSADNIKLPVWIIKFSHSNSIAFKFASTLISVHLPSFQLRFF